ncbi:MAG TPA: nitrate/nitrite transporter NrtS [Anaerolineales bacterium]
MMRLPVWVSLCLSKPVVRRALYSALIVGTILIAINHGDALIRGEIDPTRVFKIILTILVPYLVSTISSVLTIIDSQKDPPHE